MTENQTICSNKAKFSNLALKNPIVNTKGIKLDGINLLSKPKKEFKFIRLKKDGTREKISFSPRNNVNADPMQFDPQIMKVLNYTLLDAYRMTKGEQPGWIPWWPCATAYGDTLPPNRGIERLEPGMRSHTGMQLDQMFANRHNHMFKTMVHNVFRILQKNSALKFYCGDTVADAGEEEWVRRHIRFVKPILQMGTRKQNYQIVKYYEDYEAGTYVTTGYEMVIPFRKLFQNGNGAKGKYSIDKFLIQGFTAIAIGFKDFYYILFFEVMHSKEDPFLKYLEREQYKFDSLDDYLKYYETVFGIFNTEHRIDKEYKEYPFEHLIKLTTDRIRQYNTAWPQNKSIGITVDDHLTHGERYKEYNNQYSKIGPKTGTFRNTDTLDEGEDIWKTEKKKATIFGLSKFKDLDNPEGFSPLQQMIRRAYFLPIPTWEEVIDKEHIERYEIKHHDVKCMNTEKLPINYNWIKYEQVLEFINDDIFKTMFHTEGGTFNNFLTMSFGDENDDKKKYLDNIYDIVVKGNWSKFMKECSLEHVIEDIKYAIQEGTHVMRKPKPGEKPLNTLKGVKELFKLINLLVKFMKEFGTPTMDGAQLKLKLFLYFILDSHTLSGVLSEDLNTLNKGKNLDTVFGNIVEQLKDITKANSDPTNVLGLKLFGSLPKGPQAIKVGNHLKIYIDQEIYSPRDLIASILQNVPGDHVNKVFLRQLMKWNIPPFFKPVLLLCEDISSWASFMGTEKFAEKVEIMPLSTTTFDEEILEAKVKFTNSLAIREDDTEASCLTENTKLNLPAKKAISCKLPNHYNQYYKLYIFYYRTNLDHIKRLFYKGIPEILVRFIKTEGHEALLRAHEYINEQINRHLSILDFLEPEFTDEHEQYEYYIRGKRDKIKMPDFAYKAGYYKYNPNSRDWDDYVPTKGPMGKFYDHRK